MKTTINHLCPRSGEPVQSDSLTTYRGRAVGFCNPGCRDDFDNGGPRAVDDRRYFDVLIREQSGLLGGGRATRALEAALPTLDAERICLRAPRDGDADALFALFASPEVTRYWSHPPYTERQQAVELIDSICQGAMSRQFLSWIIADRRTDLALGTTTLFSLNRTHRRAEVGFALNQNQWGKGLAREAMQRAMHFAETELELLRFEADVDPENQASLKLLSGLGFTEEGRARARWRVGGSAQDSILLARLVGE